MDQREARLGQGVTSVLRRRRGRARSWVEFTRAAPVVVLAVLGAPIVLVVSGLVLLGMAIWEIRRLGLHVAVAPAPHASALAGWGLLLEAAVLPAYWLLALSYRLLRPVLEKKRPAFRSGPAPVRPEGLEPPSGAGATGDRCLEVGGRRFTRIGIVLAGGGAKGVYQAAALQAIHDFLAERGASPAVGAVAGTSIGSWNALFWLGGLLGAGRAGSPASPLESWWTSYRFTDLVQPARFIVPGWSPHLFTNEPWGEQFDRLFGAPDSPGHAGLLASLRADAEDGRPGLRFFFSRTSVLPGRLAFDTNDPLAVVRTGSTTHDMDLGRRSTTISMVREAVFASMGIPPLFPYVRIEGAEGSAWSEDGGVVDNLPIRLAMAFGECDLLFVLPLNSSFAIQDRPRLLPTRLWRVLDVRQGILERAALKQTYLFNIQRALSRQRVVPSFVVCPGHPLRVSTTELWRSRDLRAALFQQTRLATAVLLGEFFEPARLDDFFAAFDAKAREPDRPLREAGYVRMHIIPPDWEPGAPFAEEVRF